MAEEPSVILDVDPGHDDAVAILLAAASEEIDLRGITVVAGNQILSKTLLNTRRVCSAAGIEGVAIYAGMNSPMVRDQITADHIHGSSGLEGPSFDAPHVEVQDKHAVDFIIDECLQSDTGITLAPVGPLTNVAMALRREPEIRDNIEEIVLMGGSMGLGNHTAAAEFNIFADPEAADVVFNSGLPITMVGLDLTRQAEVTPRVLDRIRSIGNSVSELVVEALEYFGLAYKKSLALDNPPLHDPCVVAYLIDRSVLTVKEMRVDIDLSHGLNYGRTVCDYYHRSEKKVNAKVALDLDKERFWEILLQNLERY